MTGTPRKKSTDSREVRRLAAKIPDQITFERIIADVGANESSELLRSQMRDAVRRELIPWLRFPFVAEVESA